MQQEKVEIEKILLKQKYGINIDTLIVIPNDRLLQISDKDIKVSEAYIKSDEILANGVKGITGLITNPGVINVDFADVKTILKDAGNAVLGIGRSTDLYLHFSYIGWVRGGGKL